MVPMFPRRAVSLSVFMIIVVCSVFAAIHFQKTEKKKTPVLVLTLSAEKCQTIPFDANNFSCGPAVDAVCNANGTVQLPVFALKGQIAQEILTIPFDRKYESLTTTSANPSIVFVYHYSN